MEVAGQIEILATDSSDGTKICVGFPTELKEAHISEEMILSYEWLSQFKIDITPWRHGLIARVNGNCAWIPGSKGEGARATPNTIPTPVNAVLAQGGFPQSVPLTCFLAPEASGERWSGTVLKWSHWT